MASGLVAAERMAMQLNLEGARVLVTAGANGIGLEIARAFVEEGARVHICDVDAAQVVVVRGERLTGSVADVSDRGQVAQLFVEAERCLGGLDVLVNNAGISGPTAPVDQVRPEDWDRVLAVNITGQFNCVRGALPLLRRSTNASIINLSSIAGRLGYPMRTAYASSKWAVIGFTKSLSLELGPSGIRVNAVLPGLVEGDRLNAVIARNAQARNISFGEAKAGWVEYTALKTTVTPRQIADTILFLCSERGRTTSGQALSVCGDVQMMV
jgi:NAD(P)-dependent dehydrogenase (short-subunit alcohol dehydrogenase family)